MDASVEVAIDYEKGKLYDLAIADLQPDLEQPRKYFDEQALNELKISIEKHGVLEPVPNFGMPKWTVKFVN